MSVAGPVRARDERRKLRVRVGLADEADDHRRTRLEHLEVLFQHRRNGVGDPVEIVEDEQRGLRFRGGVAHAVCGERGGRSSRARVGDLCSEPARERSELGREPRFTDSGRPGDEDDPPVAPPSLAPRAAQP